MCWCQIWLYSPRKWLVYFFFKLFFLPPVLYFKCQNHMLFKITDWHWIVYEIILFLRIGDRSPKKDSLKVWGLHLTFSEWQVINWFFIFFLLGSSQRAAFYHRLLAFPELKVSEKDWLDAQNPHQFYSFFLVIVCLCISSRYSQAGDVRGGGFWIDRFEKSSVHFPQQVAYMYVFWL